MATNADTLKKKITAAPSRPLTIHDQKASMVPQFQMLLNGDQKKAERAFRIAVTEFNKNGPLQQCDRASFWGCVINAVQMDLEPGPLGYAYLVPYKGVVTLQIGYRGMLELVNRSGVVDSVYAYPVYRSDKFKYALGASPDLQHVPNLDAEPEDKDIIAFYAVAHIKGCVIPRIEVMSRKQVDAIKNRAQAKSGPWITDFAEMGRKTVLKRLCKTLPLSVESQRMLAVDDTTRTSLDADVDNTESVFDVMAADVASQPAPPAPEVIDTTTGEVTEDAALFT